jgi:hypothetical protein
MLTAQLAAVAMLTAEAGKVDQLLSFGIGGLALALLLGLLVTMIAIGGGREHS